MNELSPFSKRCFGGLTALLLILGWTVESAQAQNPYPGWAAPKRIPTKSDRATFPDIAAEGDTIHVIFRATYTFVADDQGVPPEELILDEIQLIQLLLRTNNSVEIEAMGGREKLRARRQQLMEQLNQIQSRVESGQATPTSPVQTALYYTRSDDRGKTFWEDPIPIISQPETFYGQTALYVDSRGIHVGYTAEAGDNVIRVYATHSEDGGKTWSQPERLSTSDSHCYDPHMVSIPGGGLILTWWEREETTTISRTRATFEGMQESLEQGVLLGTERTQGRSIIRYARRVAGTWQTERLLAYSNQIVPYVNLAEGPNRELFVHWIDRNGVECRVSRDGGVTWETSLDFSQVFNSQRSNTFLWGGGDYHFFQGDAQLRRSSPLNHRKGLLQGAWNPIIDPQAQYSYPRFAYTKDEVQTIWGTTDNLAGQSVLYFREDNKPPTSELVYPIDGAFTKPILVFLWDAVDDIATRMTYRWTIMQRENPSDEPEPHNWFEYEAVQENPIDPLPDGYYTLFLQAKDFAGNEEPNPTKFNFQTYYVPPRIEAEGKSLPPLEIETRNLEIRWTAEDNTPGGSAPLIAYRLDGNPVTEFAPRDSIKIRGLRQGWHQVQIFAKDENGNIYPFGDTVSVRVNLSLMLNWQQRPQQPQQDGVIFVSGNTVPLSWVVTDNTEDQGTQFLSSIRYIYGEETSDWSAPQVNADYEFSGEGGAPLREGAYMVQVIAQDEFGNAALGDRNLGNLAGAYIDTSFTVDRTPPSVEFNDLVVYNEETRIPTVTVVGKDNYTHDHNLKYQFRVITREEPDPAWSILDSNPAFVADGKPIKWYSWGYRIESRAQDILGNVTTEVAVKDLTLFTRSPAVLYSLLALIALVVLGAIYMIFSSIAEKRRQKKRLAAKREAAKQSSAGAVAAAGAGAGMGSPAVGDEDDLFNVPDSAVTKTGGSEDFFGAPSSTPSAFTPPKSTSSPFDDPFSTAQTTVFDDPFADAAPPETPAPPTPSIPLEEDEPLEIGGGGASFTPAAPTAPEPDPFKIPSPDAEEPPAPPKKSDWSADKKVELDDRDLFDPL